MDLHLRNWLYCYMAGPSVEITASFRYLMQSHVVSLKLAYREVVMGVQEVVNSGLSCIVLRVGKTEGVDESLGSESAVVLGAQQSLPSQSVITKSQVRHNSQPAGDCTSSSRSLGTYNIWVQMVGWTHLIRREFMLIIFIPAIRWRTEDMLQADAG